jgi:hypothetical protein
MCNELGIQEKDQVRLSLMIDRGIMIEPLRMASAEAQTMEAGGTIIS